MRRGFKHIRISLLSLALLALSAQTVMAQDMRSVVEPVIPKSCTILSAELTAANNRLPDSAESRLDTARVQSALDHCTPGEAVELKSDGASNAFLSGPLNLRSGVTLLVDRGVTLYASRNPRLYDKTPGSCGTMSAQGHGCLPLISVTDAKNAAVMGDGTVDGQGDATVIGHSFTWWQLAMAAHHAHLLQSCPRLIIADHADGFTLYKITLHNSGNFHVVVQNTDGFTAWGIHIQSPTTRGLLALNTDGIDPGNSTNLTVAHSWIDSGDDNIAIKTNVTHMSVLDNHFYEGHGMSIGSETYSGDSYLLVDGLTEDGTTNGIRVKSNDSKGGLVHDLTYRNICMRNVYMPIALSPFYNNTPFESFTDPNIPGDRIPDFKSIRIENVMDLTPGNVLIAGKDANHVTEVLLNGVTIRGIKPSQVHAQFARVEIGPKGANFTPKGNEVTVVHVKAGTPASAWSSCNGKFLPMQ
ncbi:MAG: glycoside hydrolase [Alphaproteobacteria bacterium]|nr:glycoside hydrolase [Alphaproteobacteria bacterium]